MRLRAYLVLMSAAILIPVIGFHATALNMLEKSEREATFEQLEEKVRSLSLLIERELLSTDATLRILGSSNLLEKRDFKGLYEQAKAAHISNSAWFVLVDADGNQLFNTSFPYDTKLQPLPDGAAKIEKLTSAGRWVVTDVGYGPGLKRLVTTLATPIITDDNRQYAFLAVFKTEHFLQLIQNADINSDYVAGIVDSKGAFIARTRNSIDAVGKPTNPKLIKAIQSSRSGLIELTTLEGIESFSVYRGIDHTKWTVAIAAPRQAIDAASTGAARMAGLGMAAGIIFATLLALLIGGRIVRAIEHAKNAAVTLGKGGKPAFEKSSVSEVNELYSALTEAGEQLSQARASRKAAEARAAEAGELLQLAVDSAELGTFYCPLPLGKVYWNVNCKRHFFLPEDADVDFELFYSRIHPDDRERVRRANEAAVYEHTPYDTEYRTVSPDGRTRWIRAKGLAYYDMDDRPIRFDGVTIDISRNKEVQARLERDSRQKDEFLAMLAHELRNPLAPIASAASLLKLSSPDNPRAQKSSEMITRQVAHMAGLLDDLLDVSRVTKGIINLRNDVIDIKKVISAASEQVHPSMQSKTHQFLIELPAEPLFMLGDEKRLIQVVVNLLTNACRYTPDGGHIRLSLESDVDSLLISIKDDGIGIPDHLHPRIFDLFVQGERTPDRQQGGLGLGLPLVKSLTELHHGEVYVSSDGVGKGSVFALRFPRHVPSDETDSKESDLNKVTALESSLKIAVVDDNPDVSQMLVMLLQELGFDVTGETDPNKVLEQSVLENFDVYILDIGMPIMDGHELAKRLRSQPETKDAFLIAISGYGLESDVIKSRNAGFNHHLIKPVDIPILLGLLQEHATTRRKSLS